MSLITPIRPRPTEGATRVVIAGELSDPQFASAYRGMLDGLASGARKTTPPMNIPAGITKEQGLAAVLADPFAVYEGRDPFAGYRKGGA